MPWLPLERFRDSSIPKLDNLRRAQKAGIVVPRTVWSAASDDGLTRPDTIGLPCIVRSGSPTEDGQTTSNAGQFTTVIVHEASEFDQALRQVIEALPIQEGRRAGVVFVQPLVESTRAGVTFFDGFYYEEASKSGGNQEITSGLERGAVERGHLQRGQARDTWLVALHRIFGGLLDIEWAELADGSRILLQVRPALFPVRRNETLSLANHKEILGDPPSPWMVGLLAESARSVMGFFETVDPRIARFEEPYAIELGERAWMNFSAFFRIMDLWGMPRTSVTEGVGGASAGPLDAKLIPRAFLRSLPIFPRLLAVSFGTILKIKPRLHALERELDQSRTLLDLQRLNVKALDLSIQTNFAIMSLLSGLSKVRKRLGLNQAGRLVTAEMMAEYASLAAQPDRDDRLAGLDAWLALHGHRGPLESDPMQPRFSELREPLRASLEAGPTSMQLPRFQPSRLRSALLRPLFWLDEIREDFRDQNMRLWQKIRLRILGEAESAVAAGHLETPQEVFFLRAEDLAADPPTWPHRVHARTLKVDAVRLLELPTTAFRDVIEDALLRRMTRDSSRSEAVFRGSGLDRSVSGVRGIAVRATGLTSLLQRADLPDSPVLIVETLEPSWAVVFPRFKAVVAELGGELSHASILLREAGIPAVVNASGAFRSISDGESVSVDPRTGEVRILASPGKIVPQS